MLYVKNLTSEEKQILANHYKKAGCALIRERAHAIILSGQKRTAPDIALILMRNETTIRQWLNDFNEIRLASIFHKYEGNANASKLTREQKNEIRETLLKPPSEYGLPKNFWGVPILKDYLKGEFGAVYESERSYHYLLGFCGLSFKLPTPFDFKRDVEKINQRLAEISQEIQPYLRDKNWEIFMADETRLIWEAEIRRAWIRKNEKTIIKVHRDSQYQNLFGALNLKNKTAFTCRLNWQNQSEIIQALEELLKHYPNKKICIVWDNAGWHKGKLLSRTLKKNYSLARVHLINLPPYAPDVNPMENVWNFGKDCISNDNVPDSFLKTVDLFEDVIKFKTFDYKMPEFVLR